MNRSHGSFAFAFWRLDPPDPPCDCSRLRGLFVMNKACRFYAHMSERAYVKRCLIFLFFSACYDLRRQVVLMAMALKKEVPVLVAGCDRWGSPRPPPKSRPRPSKEWPKLRSRLNSLNVARYAEACTSVVADESSRHDNQAVEWSSFTGGRYLAVLLSLFGASFRRFFMVRSLIIFWVLAASIATDWSRASKQEGKRKARTR